MQKQLLTVRETVGRLKDDGLPISDKCLRDYLKKGYVPCVKTGKVSLIYYPNIVEYLTGSRPTHPN